MEPDGNHEKGQGEKIGKLDSWSVHRICSGQVIVCLAVAVKELVENALDAGATDVVIRTKEFGSKLIEVQDNGVGIKEENFDALCRKHYTSKLNNFAELENILTFGFRGEALSSLCALGELSVTTKHESKEVGNALKFNTEGLLAESRPCARATGTTVTVENIFVSLPVRHKQFMGNLKKEFAKMVHFMSGYCLIARDVAISLVNIDERGKRHEILKKRAHSAYKDNIVEIFGFKETTKLLPYEQIPISEDIKQEFGLGSVSTEHLEEVSVEGLISNCEHGSGRSSADRQFVFVNSRPCDFPKLTRVINGVYHQFNSSQYPFVMLNIITPRRLVDVNLTPDKRMLMLQRENVILAMVKASLTAMFQKQATKYTVSSVSKIGSFSRRDSGQLELEGDSGDEDEEVKETRSRCAPAREKKMSIFAVAKDNDSEPAKPSFRERFSFKNDTLRGARTSKRSYTETLDAEQESKPRTSLEPPTLASFGFTRHLGKKPRSSGDFEDEEATQQPRFNLANLSQKPNQDANVEIEEGEDDEPKPSTAAQKSRKSEVSEVTHLLVRDTNAEAQEKEEQEVSGTPVKGAGEDEEFDLVMFSDKDSSNSGHESPESEGPSNSKARSSPAPQTTKSVIPKTGSAESSPQKKPCVSVDDEELDGVVLLRKRLRGIGDSNSVSKNAGLEKQVVLSEEDPEASSELPEPDREVEDGGEEPTILFVDETPERKVGVHALKWTEEDMIRDFEMLECGNNDQTDSKDGSQVMCRFRARISPRENNTAESELMREITKDMFKEMDIIGQFNRGFIIAKLNTDLFIVDQHAADEKFNFETLQATTVIDSQPLTIPLKLFLAPGNEQVILEHLSIFDKNGFRLSCDESAPCGRKLSLTAVPQSGQWAMGASEIDELVFMLNENYHPNLMNCRPSKVRAMFAMRACRKSVMVGHELKPRDMKRVVAQLSGLQHPWNCPHGRPTMRHLVNLNLVHL